MNILWECAFCGEDPVTLIDGTLVCGNHKDNETVSEMLRQRFAPVLEGVLGGLVQKLSEIDEEMKILKDMKG
ncbi:hypothetical protein KAR91_77840 [Candidatus Pacearchaeota archaeon]|nr:hypothetical protein [Candidatus Pacearchaeota archaeon]